jgi:L-lactate utilization protein LutB
MNITTKQNAKTVLAGTNSVAKTIESLRANNFLPHVVSGKTEALEKIKELIPDGASIMNGTSETLREIGFVDHLKSATHGWNNLHDSILAESDKEKQSQLRNQALFADYYLGSVHALTQTGEMIIVSNTGSQLPHLVFTSPNIILVVGNQKIVPTLSEAFARVNEVVVPKEDVRARKVYGMGTMYAKTLILHKENPMMGRKVHVIIVNESLGF